MPNTRLILHVKGTEAETAELPKDVVRAAISQGQLTYSQLIWSPAHNTWKQVRELPELLPEERLILHVKGTQAETRELPKQVVRAAISEGQLTHSQLIWSHADSAWKQVRELPDLWPSQEVAPAPSRAAAVPVPRVIDAIIPESPTSPVARAAAAAGQPQVRVAAADAPQVRVAAVAAGTPTIRAAAPTPVPSTGKQAVKNGEKSSYPLKWICIGLGIFILLVFGGNYLLVDHPLVSNLSQTPYSNAKVFAHFGAFMQPNVIVIHISASSNITPDNLTDFLVALAHSTPQSPFTGDAYTRVALTSGWTAQYTFSGDSWKELGDAGQETKAQQKEDIMNALGNAGGQSLIESTLNEEAQKARYDQVWNDFTAHFTAKQ
jgi:hypothetical protein